MPLRSAHASSVLQAVWHLALSMPRCEARRLMPSKRVLATEPPLLETAPAAKSNATITCCAPRRRTVLELLLSSPAERRNWFGAQTLAGENTVPEPKIGMRWLAVRSPMRSLCRDGHNKRRDRRNSRKARHNMHKADSSRKVDSSHKMDSHSRRHTDRHAASSSDALLAEPYERLFHRIGRRVSRQ